MRECLLKYEFMDKDITKLYEPHKEHCSYEELQKNLENISMKLRDAKKLYGMTEKYLIFFLFSTHGILRDGTQCIVLNEYDKKTQYYKMYLVEKKLRFWAEIYPNLYIISIFACCR